MKLPDKINRFIVASKVGDEYLAQWESAVELKQKVNELIDYLSDKEDGRYYILDRRIAKSEDIDKDMGECVCSFQHLNNGEVNANIRSDCPVHNPFPPQQEESRGECEHFYGYLPRLRFGDLVIPKRCKYCGEREPQIKEESPKEDEVEELFKIIEKHGEGTSEGAIYWESWADEPQSLKQELAGYIKANFVSKVKARRELLNESIDEPETTLHIAVNNALYRVRKELGLEELC